MTALNLATDLPDQITTAEQLLVHQALTLHNLYKGQEYQEARGTQFDSGLAPLIDVSSISAKDGTERLLIRAAVEIDPSYRVDITQKMWMFAEPFGNVVIPAAYKTNS